LCFIATAQALDDEMAERIARHKADRGPRWRLRETPLDLVAALREEARPERVVLVDCLTLWLSNLMHADSRVEMEVPELARTIKNIKGPALFVSNEVGLGVAPAYELGRTFRDAQGRLNAAMAEACEAVVWLAAGLPTLLKPAPRPMITFR
jgi:adenosylcobinamide kinase/adenosylcobinamide-phosphate guanylyltransferase